MIETMANEYSSESTLRELSNEYQHDRVSMIFKDFCVLVLSTNIGSALEGLIHEAGNTHAFLGWCKENARIFLEFPDTYGEDRVKCVAKYSSEIINPYAAGG